MASTPTSCFKGRHFYLMLQFLSLFLLYFPIGLGLYFGNLAVYLNSYTYIELHTSKFQSQWIMSTYLIIRSITIIIVGNVIKKMDRWKCILIGVLFYNTGVFLSYFAVQYSQMAYVITLGAVTGIGYGFIQTEMLTRMPIIVSKRVGLSIAIVNTFMNLGAVLFNWLITWYANGSNREADVPVGGHYVVFGEKSVIDRVPGLFLILGIMTSTCHILGFLLSAFLKDKGAPEKSVDYIVVKTKNFNKGTQESTSLTQDAKGVGETGETYDSVCTMTSSDSVIKIEKGLTSNGSSIDVTPHPRKAPGRTEGHADRDVGRLPEAVSNDLTSIHDDLNQLQMLKTISFYILWFSMFASDASYIVLLNFYKIFGELWIQDDHFLTNLGMASLLAVIPTRMIWALIMDQFGVKNTQVILSSSLSLTFAFYFFAPQIDQWLFACVTCLASALSTSVYVVYPVFTLKLFGQTHFAANYGLVITSTIVLNLIVPESVATVVDHFGWAAVFLGTNAINALALIAVVVGLPEALKGHRK